MEKKNKIIITAAVVIIVVIIVAVVLLKHPSSNTPSNGAGATGQTAANATGTPSAGMFASSTTAAPLTGNVVVPQKGAATGTVSANVAVPQVQGPAAPGVATSYRSFNISANNNTFSPSTVIVNLGDTVNLEITAVDKDYNFTQPDYGFNTTIPKGVTKTIQFEATTQGKFTFYCASCGGPSSGPVGYIEVAGAPSGN